MSQERRALVTGGAGFIGSHLVDALLSRGWKVTVLDDLSTGSVENLPAAATLRFLEGSVLNPAKVSEAMAGVHTVFHLAASVSVPFSVEHPETSFRINADGTLISLEAARHAGVRRFIYSGSSARYGDGPELPKREGIAPQALSVYAAGKLAGEALVTAYAKSYALETVSLVYFNIFGPRQSPDSPYAAVIPIFLSKIMSNQPITVFGDGEQTRDFTYVANVVQANLLAADAEKLHGESVNVAGGESISLNRLISEISETVGVSPEVVYAPPRPGDVVHSSADISAAKRLLGYEPTVLWREGLRLTVDALRTMG
jgi:UDP-glucose 4-epimerase